MSGSPGELITSKRLYCSSIHGYIEGANETTDCNSAASDLSE